MPTIWLIVFEVFLFLVLVADAYLVTHRKSRPPQLPSEREQNDLLYTHPRQWAEAAAAELEQGAEKNADP